jgi:hypothetical protein
MFDSHYSLLWSAPLDVSFVAGYSTHPVTRMLARVVVIAGITLIILVASPVAFVVPLPMMSAAR